MMTAMINDGSINDVLKVIMVMVMMILLLNDD
jgi:hypothetical protein